MTEHNPVNPQPSTIPTVPYWFRGICLLALLWFLMDFSAFYMRITVTEEMRLLMSEQERYIHRDYPLWVNTVFAFEVFGGLLGSLALLLKRRLALGLFGLSLFGVLAQSGYVYFISDAVEVLGSPMIFMPLLSIAIGSLMMALAKGAISRQWLH